MSKDLEDFLRQAAEMRQRKQAERRAEADQHRELQTRSQPSPYSNARRERAVDDATGYYDDVEDEILDERDIEIIDAIHIDDDQANRSGKTAADTPAAAMPDAKISSPEHANSRSSQSNAAVALKELIRKPDGLRQAFLIREILNRPRF